MLDAHGDLYQISNQTTLGRSEREILCDFEHTVVPQIIAYEQPYTFLYVGKWTAILDKRIVIRNSEDPANIVYEKITPTKTGNYTFHFNRWIKLAEMPELEP